MIGRDNCIERIGNFTCQAGTARKSYAKIAAVHGLKRVEQCLATEIKASFPVALGRR